MYWCQCSGSIAAPFKTSMMSSPAMNCHEKNLSLVTRPRKANYTFVHWGPGKNSYPENEHITKFSWNPLFVLIMEVLVALCCCVFSSAIASSHECHWYSPLQLYWCWRDLICVLYSMRQENGEHMIHFKLRSKLPFNICVMIDVVNLLCQDHEIELDSASPSS